MESPPPPNDSTRFPADEDDDLHLRDDDFADERYVGEREPDEEAPPPDDADVGRKRWSPIALLALGLTTLAGLMVVIAAWGTQWGLWDFRAGFTLLDWGVYVALGAAAISVIAMLMTRGAGRRGLYLAGFALLLALIIAFIPWNWRRSLQSGPPIHDLSTDLENPPEFAAAAQRRGPDDLPLQYGGPSVAQHQRRAYPDIRPLIIDLQRDRAFQRALDAAEAMGWEIVAASPSAGRIEATDQSPWFGFKDDIVIRLTPLEGRTLIDVRSLAREPRGDSRGHAERLRNYLRRVEG